MQKRKASALFIYSLIAILLIFCLFYILPSLVSKEKGVTGFTTRGLSRCADLFNTGYGYYLSSNIVDSKDYCFNIGVPNVEINCRGYSIINNNTNAIGIYSNALNTTIRNCVISTNISSGIGIMFTVTARNGSIINNIIKNNAFGIRIFAEGNNITQNTFIDNSMHMDLDMGPSSKRMIYNNVFIDTKIKQCGDISAKGTYILNSNIIANNSRINCLNITDSNVEINCRGYSIINNNTNAIGIYSNALNTTIRNCVISTNISSGIGIKFTAQAPRGFIINNTLKDSYQGISISSNDNSISNNIFSNNARNIFIDEYATDNTLSGNDFGSGPKVYFKFDNYNDDDNFIDSVNPGLLSGIPIPDRGSGPKRLGNPSPGAPQGDYYALFNGNNYINVSSFRALSISPDSPITVMFWAQASSSNMWGRAAIFSVDVSNPNNSRQFVAYLPWDDKMLYWDYGNISSKGRIKYDYTDDFGDMTHIALVSGGVKGNFKAIYINGELVNSEANSSGPDGIFGKLIIGCIPNYKVGSEINTYCYKGALDDFMIYDRVVESEEIKQIYDSQADKFTDERFYNDSEYNNPNPYGDEEPQTVELTVDDLQAGHSVSLRVNDDIQLTIADEYFYLTLEALTNSKATFIVDYDEENNFTVDINKTVKFDFDSDDIYDISMKFDNLSSGNTEANFFLKAISEPVNPPPAPPVPPPEITNLTNNVTNITNATGSNNKITLPSYLLVLIIASFAVLIIILIIWIYLEVTKGKSSKDRAIGISFPKYDAFRKPSF